MAWNVEELKKIRFEHYKILDNATNSTMVEDAEMYISYLDELIELLNYYNGDEEEITDDVKPSYQDTVKEDKILLDSFYAYTPFVNEFAKYYKKYIIEQTTLPHFKTNPDNILKTTNQFYSKLGEPFSSTYRSLANTFDTRLQFFELLDRDATWGYTYFFPFTNDIFIKVSLADSLQDMSTMNHEAGHGIANMLNPFIALDYEKYGFSEVESLFLELIGDDFIAKKFNKPREMHMKRLRELKMYMEDAYYFSVKERMYNNLSRKEYKKRSIAKKYIQSITGAKMADTVLNSDLTSPLQYLISYLTAIELYMKYQNNPEEALDKFYNIIMLEKMDVNGYMNAVQAMGIIPGAHLSEFVDRLVDIDMEVSKKRLIIHK